ncbi:MAG: DUF934 domain-containing protein [Betaproteobacteria bacterium]
MARLIKDRRLVDQPSPPELTLEPAEDIAAIADRLAGLRVVAVRFPKYADGRGYSIGRLLRERHGYQGELRAVGEVARDHLQSLAQCGFDAFELREGEDLTDALAAFEDFSDAYQATAAQPLPLFRRRAPG